ncbi:hypothetical protein [Candidatus Mycoplasma mahonii]|uniref:hypothetical protein n=1 Tax=Candidatus Mycoplasma mahonii TaxID=3004105 RepID=UPI0026EE640C|nr:hypothetical protein [Candidatus Mycoplasma mahonii]WKX02539.1 hypothetical protein O3I44_00455 [Candidatus Mycoplasma mahonii]
MSTLSTPSIILLLIIVGFLSAIIASLIRLWGGLIAIPLILLIIDEDKFLHAKLIAYVSIFALL